MEIIAIEIDTEFIELNHLLKLAGQALSGGEGKVIVASGAVFVDGEQELRMRCKIRPGMLVRYKEVGISVSLAAAGLRAPKVVGAAKPKTAKKPATNNAKTKILAPTTQKRRPRAATLAPKTGVKVGAKLGAKVAAKLPAKLSTKPSGYLTPGPGNKGVSRGGAKVDAKRKAKFGIKQ